ncbi:BON domain-containing protein [Trinickia mobilis]|uniref:BON domain-containing protein n=1 Tax=Trinickia mobilis TaxID=2816356 RepID=UPI001A9087D5|nr:BON domain-containing protein [Trinickia mobilis]
MKPFHAARWVGCALLALTTCSAIAQNGSASEMTPAATSSSSAKAMRAANRELQKKVRQALIHTKGLNASGIAVRASNGAVTLQGWVPEQSQVALAMQAANGVPGVTSVICHLTVRPVGQ